MKIDYPSEHEIRASIEQVLDGGLPRRKSFFGFMKEMHAQLGNRIIFRDFGELLVIGAVYLVAVVGAFAFVPVEAPIYGLLFMGSPLFLGGVSLLTLLDKQEVFELEATCRYTIYQVLAYRMLVFASFSILANVGTVLVLAAVRGNIDLVPALAVTLSGLFVFAIGFLYVTKHRAQRWKQLGTIFCWVALNVSVAIWSDGLYEAMLLRLPYPVYGLVLAGLGWIFYKSLSGLLQKPQEI